MFHVVGSAGHKYNTPGKRTHAFSDGSHMKEYEHNRVVFDELIRLLKLDYRFSVYDTSPSKYEDSITNRCNLANKYKKDNKIARDKILYISVHANADSSKLWSFSNGCEVLHYPGSIEGEKFAKEISNEISTALDVKNRGSKARRNLGILNKTKMPAVITEAAFMTNKIEASKLKSHVFRLKEAYAIYKGICKGFGLSVFIKRNDVDQVKLVLNPEQDVNIVISTNKAMTLDEIIAAINESTSKRQYTISEKQDLLNKCGYYCGAVDGSKGKMTIGAIKAFQRLNKLDETGVLDFNSIALLNKILVSKEPHRTFWFNDSEVHAFIGSHEEYNLGLELGVFGKLEKLSELAKGHTCSINGQFFGGGREGLGMLLNKGRYYFKPINDKFANWIQYRNGKSEIRDVYNDHIMTLKSESTFAIGTSWPLFVNGNQSPILMRGIAHKHSRHPRTIISDTFDERVVFLVVDGRSKISKGMTAKQCQSLIKFVETTLNVRIRNSVNLDGGGSAEMIIDGVIVNKPSDGFERRIGTSLYLDRRV